MEMSKELKDMAEALAMEAKVTLPIDIFDKKHRNRLSRTLIIKCQKLLWIKVDMLRCDFLQMKGGGKV